MLKNIKEALKNKKIIFFISLVITLILIVFTFIPNGLIDKIKNIMTPIKSYEISYEIKNYDLKTDIYEVLLTIESIEGIESVENTDIDQKINAHGKNRIAIDYKVTDRTVYDFVIKLCNGQTKYESLEFGRERIGKGTYKKVKGLYVNTPNLDGYEKEFTRYLKYTTSDALQPANWITDDEPDNWYDYKNKKWANIYVENEGVGGYFVWIPRYCYKIDDNYETGNERVDIKFIDVYNDFRDGNSDALTEWSVLKEQGYKVPEAFEWGKFNEISISGYWISKYELSDLDKYAIDYDLSASSRAFNVINLTKDTEKEVAQYTFAINGEIVHTATEIEDYSFVNGKPEQSNVVNVTALDSNGSIVASMTKKNELADPNEPDLDGFDKDTTFYVYWDENGNEHNEIPISKEPPSNWYNYTYSEWANVVTRNNGIESYFVWIPRYQYALNTTNERTKIKFIKGLGTDVETGYKIPEAFTWNGKELYGYWISKYELSEEQATSKISADIGISEDRIRVQDITGSLITEAIENNTSLKIEYYLDGDKAYEGSDIHEHYSFENLETYKTYTVNIIVRDRNSNKYIGAITRKVTTKYINKPNFEGFVEDRTYYVLYDNNGNMTIGDKIKTDGSNMPSNWYDYTNKKWANIVVTDGTIQNGQIVGATSTSYFVWIPRYQYALNTTTQRVDAKFIDGNGTDTDEGYKIPEAFTWNGKELYGYWISKYELSE